MVSEARHSCRKFLTNGASKIAGYYRFADWTICSELALEELPAVQQDDSCAVDLVVNSPTTLLWKSAGVDWIFHWPTPTAQSGYSVAKIGSGFLLRFWDAADFAVSADGHRIGPWLGPSANYETLRHLLLDHVLPRVLAHQGELVLHAGAVRVSGCAIAFIGNTGSGKSTLTASFRAAGHPILSDDGLVLNPIDGGVSALPTYPSLRLWPESVAGLYPEPPTLAPMAHYSTKERVVLSEDETTGEPSPVASIYVLAPAPGTGTPTITLTRLSPRDACMAIVENSFQLDVTDTRRATALLAKAAEVAKQVPAFRLAYTRDFALLPSVRAAILNHRSPWAEGIASGSAD